MSKQVDPYDIDAMKNAIHELIEASPVVAHCHDCGEEIRKAEIDLNIATMRDCSSCVMDYAASVI